MVILLRRIRICVYGNLLLLLLGAVGSYFTSSYQLAFKSIAVVERGKLWTGPKHYASRFTGPVIERTELQELMEELLSEMMGRDNSKDVHPSRENTAAPSAILDSVVRVFCTHSEPNFAMPWQRLKQDYSTSTGFVIQGRRILTNAHSVEYGSLVQVKKRQSEDKFVASVLAVGHECDLAILEVEDEAFWNDLDPLEFGELPDLFEDVNVIGYPVGGDGISISSGVVSRIEMQEYAQACTELLAIQIDAAINPGNSGGPVTNSEDQVSIVYAMLALKISFSSRKHFPFPAYL